MQNSSMKQHEPIEEHHRAGIVQFVHLKNAMSKGELEEIQVQYGLDIRTLLKSGTSVMSTR